MAKRLGVTEPEIHALADPESALLTDGEKVALRYAEEVTQASDQISDTLFAALKQHFSEAAIIEITVVIGLFNYFNRFNTALGVDIAK